jgi:hypothetical protein
VATQVVEDTKGKIRDRPISDPLRALLQKAGTATKIETVLVTSGGQAAKGTPGKRTGSTRHDLGNAADLQLLKGGRALDFTNLTERPVVEAFVTAAASHGATGIGAGIDYMGSKTIHIGFGSKMVWGAGGKAANAPEWLRRAAEKGWATQPGAGVDAAPVASGTPRPYVVVARGGLRLRGGPGLDFGHVSTVPAGTRVLVTGFDPADPRWAIVDLEGDGRMDGYLFAAYLVAAASEGSEPGCCADESDW